MATDWREPGFATSQAEMDAGSVRKAQAYLECRRHGQVPSDDLTREWERFYRACDQAIRRFAVRCRAQSVADCSQEVWKSLVAQLPEFQSGPQRPAFLSWLYRLVRNKAIDQIRERTRHPTGSLTEGAKELVSPSEGDPVAEWDRQALRSRVHEVLGELAKQIPERSYRILYLHWIEGQEMAEIAQMLDLSIEKVWTRHHRAKQKFRCLFECHTDEGFPPV